MPTLVITADSSVTTWDCSRESKPFVLYPNGDIPVSDAVWNHNGQVLATCSALSTDEQVHNNIVLTAAQSGNRLDSLQHNQQWTRPAGAINSLAFGGKSRYLCIGDESGAVCLWDLKKRLRVRQFFQDGHPARQVSLDPTDTYVLSLAPRIFSSYKLREGTMARTLLPPGNAMFTRYHTSTIETNFAAIGSSDGNIHLYDIVDQAHSNPLISFGLRNSYITGLAFSPNSSKLLLASDQDGALTMFDKNTGEIAQNIASFNGSIMAMDMHSDGFEVAVGTETGQVLLYDIRQASPISSMYVEGPVSSLQFAPPPKNKGSNQHALVQQASSDQKENESEPILKSQTLYSAPYSVTKTVASQQTGTTNHNVYSGPPSSNKPPSPQKTSAPKPNTAMINQRYAGHHAAPAAKPETPRMLAPSLAEIQSAKQNLSTQNSIVTTAANTVGGYEGPPSSSSTTNPSPEKLPRQPLQSPGFQSPPSSRLTPTSQPRNRVESAVASSGSKMQFSSSTQEALNMESVKIPTDEIREVVRDEVESLKDDIEEAIRNLHMDMISQFHQQSQELKNTLSIQMATIERLTEENQILRETNERLKGENQSDNMS